MFLWRISNHASLDGRGGLIASARWHTLGRPIVYLATSPAAALAEVLVHLELDIEELPDHYELLKAEAPEGLRMLRVDPEALPKGWESDEVVTRSRGDEWLAAGESALLEVPSAIVPETFNVLLNPSHRDAARVKVLWHKRYPYDRRLFRKTK
jgi:RES domain-containing protein